MPSSRGGAIRGRIGGQSELAGGVYLFTAGRAAAAGENDPRGGCAPLAPPGIIPRRRVATVNEVRIVLVRHGRTRWNHERRFLGVTDLELDPVGRDEAAALGERLAGTFTAVYTSPLARARQTAAALAPPEAVAIPALRELCQGDLEGLDGPTAFERYPAFFTAFQADPSSCRPPGTSGETLAEVQERALAALAALARAHAPGDRIAVVSHQMVIASVTCALRGAPLARWREFGVANAGTVTLRWDGALAADGPDHGTGGSRASSM